MYSPSFLPCPKTRKDDLNASEVGEGPITCPLCRAKRAGQTLGSLCMAKGMPVMMTPRPALSAKSSPSLTLPLHPSHPLLYLVSAPLTPSPIPCHCIPHTLSFRFEAFCKVWQGSPRKPRPPSGDIQESSFWPDFCQLSCPCAALAHNTMKPALPCKVRLGRHDPRFFETPSGNHILFGRQF